MTAADRTAPIIIMAAAAITARITAMAKEGAAAIGITSLIWIRRSIKRL